MFRIVIPVDSKRGQHRELFSGVTKNENISNVTLLNWRSFWQHLGAYVQRFNEDLALWIEYDPANPPEHNEELSNDQPAPIA